MQQKQPARLWSDYELMYTHCQLRAMFKNALKGRNKKRETRLRKAKRQRTQSVRLTATKTENSQEETRGDA